jgi:hypothetical protein
MATQDDKAPAVAAPAAAAPAASAAAAPAASSAQSASAAAANNNAPSAAAPAAPTAASSSASAAAPAAPASSASASAAAPAKKQWSAADIAQVPEGADPLDYINMEKLKEDNKNMPTTKEGINEFLQTMPITADIMPGALPSVWRTRQPPRNAAARHGTLLWSRFITWLTKALRICVSAFALCVQIVPIRIVTSAASNL